MFARHIGGRTAIADTKKTADLHAEWVALTQERPTLRVGDTTLRTLVMEQLAKEGKLTEELIYDIAVVS